MVTTKGCNGQTGFIVFNKDNDFIFVVRPERSRKGLVMLFTTKELAEQCVAELQNFSFYPNEFATVVSKLPIVEWDKQALFGNIDGSCLFESVEDFKTNFPLI
jgi:hypothetical protein